MIFYCGDVSGLCLISDVIWMQPFFSRFGDVPYGPGDKEQLMCQDATAKFIGSDILHKVQQNYFLLYQADVGIEN
jgi:hypothetical protein